MGLLRDVYAEIIIPPAVRYEVVERGAGRAGAAEVSQAAWIRMQPPAARTLADALEEDLGSGESEAIALADEYGGSLSLLLGDRPARDMASSLGLTALGSAGVLVLAKKRGVIERVQPILDELLRAGLYLGVRDIDEILAQARE